MDLPPPSVVTVAPAAMTPIASGTEPGWRLARRGKQVVLTIAGAAPLRMTSLGWRDTPAGRALRMTTTQGDRATLLVVHALCTSRTMPGPATPIATFSLGSTVLRGCLDRADAR